MELEEFQESLLRLTSFLRSGGFFATPNRLEAHVFGRLVDYEGQIPIILHRIEQDIEDHQLSTKISFESMKAVKELDDTVIKDGIVALEKLMLDLSDFYVYTRIFLDALALTVKLSFKKSGNKNADLMKHTIKCLLNKQTLNIYKQKIDQRFFVGLEQHLSWITDFRDSRDGLVHQYHHFVFTYTKQGEMGYDIMDLTKISWGTESVKAIMPEIKKHVDDLTKLLNYLQSQLPRKEL
jgi:hypothetical protein